MAAKKKVVIADLDVIPLGTESTSLGKYIAEVVKAVKSVKDVRLEVTPMGTILEAQ